MDHLEKLDNSGGEIIVESRKVFGYRLHTHTYYEMILYEPFDGRITVNGREIEISSMTAVILSPLDFHETAVRTETSAKYIKIGFNADILDHPVFDDSLVLEGIPRDGLLCRLFAEMLENPHEKPYLTRLIGCAAYIILRSGARVLSAATARGRSISAGALKVINERFKEDISLSLVARKLSITPQYLSRAFKQCFGMNFSQYLSNIRLKYAASMMENTSESITDICFESGFGNFSHFSRSFKRLFGISPRAYRAMQFRGDRSADRA